MKYTRLSIHHHQNKYIYNVGIIYIKGLTFTQKLGIFENNSI